LASAAWLGDGILNSIPGCVDGSRLGGGGSMVGASGDSGAESGVESVPESGAESGAESSGRSVAGRAGPSTGDSGPGPAQLALGPSSRLALAHTVEASDPR